MTIHKVIEGIGFCATGSESDYILFIDDGGRTRTVSATDMVPVDARAGWAHLDALIGGFGEARSREHLETEYAKTPTPQAYRLRITVEAFPLTEAGTAALLKSALDRSIADEKEGIEAAKTELRGLFARVEATFESEAMDWEAKYVAILGTRQAYRRADGRAGSETLLLLLHSREPEPGGVSVCLRGSHS